MNSLRKNAHAMLQEGKAKIVIAPRQSKSVVACRPRQPGSNYSIVCPVDLEVHPSDEFGEEWESRVWEDGVSFKQFDLYTEALEAALILVNADWEEVQEKLDL